VTFIDTSALVSLLTSSDAHHLRAAQTFASLAESDERLATTDLIAVEAASLLQRRSGFAMARRLVREVLEPIAIHAIDEALFRAGVEEWTSAERRHLSLVDCISFAFMRSRGIERAFAFDRDYAAAGFTLV
jgi:predicted nucleic acid-binding protein